MPQKEGSLGTIVIFCNSRRPRSGTRRRRALRLRGCGCEARASGGPGRRRLRHHTRACSDERQPVLVLVLGRVAGARRSVGPGAPGPSDLRKIFGIFVRCLSACVSVCWFGPSAGWESERPLLGWTSYGIPGGVTEAGTGNPERQAFCL